MCFSSGNLGRRAPCKTLQSAGAFSPPHFSYSPKRILFFCSPHPLGRSAASSLPPRMKNDPLLLTHHYHSPRSTDGNIVSSLPKNLYRRHRSACGRGWEWRDAKKVGRQTCHAALHFVYVHFAPPYSTVVFKPVTRSDGSYFLYNKSRYNSSAWR